MALLLMGPKRGRGFRGELVDLLSFLGKDRAGPALISWLKRACRRPVGQPRRGSQAMKGEGKEPPWVLLRRSGGGGAALPSFECHLACQSEGGRAGEGRERALMLDAELGAFPSPSRQTFPPRGLWKAPFPLQDVLLYLKGPERGLCSHFGSFPPPPFPFSQKNQAWSWRAGMLATQQAPKHPLDNGPLL